MNSRATRAATGARQPNLEPVPGDYFTTHPDSIRALLSVERFPGIVWEPACGDGTMARTISEQPDVTEVIASDLYDHGFGTAKRDFLTAGAPIDPVNHIITNPPFDLAEEFALRALALAPSGKIAMFFRLAWLEGSRRYTRLYRDHPPARIWVFSKRQPLRRNGGDWQSGLIAFAWFVWDSDHRGPPNLGWLP